MFLSRTLTRDLGFRTINYCRRAIVSASNLAGYLNGSSNQFRIAPIAGSLTALSGADHCGRGFDKLQARGG